MSTVQTPDASAPATMESVSPRRQGQGSDDRRFPELCSCGWLLGLSVWFEAGFAVSQAGLEPPE